MEIGRQKDKEKYTKNRRTNDANDVSKKAVEMKCKKWKPYSSIGARYMYKALDYGYTKREFHLYKGALYEVGSALSFFSVKNYADEYLAALDKNFKIHIDEDDSEDESVGATAEDIKEATKDFILKELSKKLKGYDLELFIANLLQAMGYRTTVSPHGGDSGIDITAYKDELPPRILVQVKSGDSDIKEATIQSLKGAMREGDYGLFVTLANYTKNARKYLEGVPIIKGINGTELVDLILKYYEDLSEKYQKMIPLEMVYIPVPLEED